jgi:hypothetical protein
MKINAPSNRNHTVYAVIVAVVIVIGLASRKFAWLLPSLLKKNAGDILWATMVFFLVGLLLPRLSTLRIAIISALFSVFIEFFKFFHAPALDAFRDTTMGRLIFGYGFSWSNLVCYGLGILLGVAVDMAWRNWRRTNLLASHSA